MGHDAHHSISLRLLGPVGLVDADGTSILSVLSQPKRVAILAYLAASATGGFLRRDKILALFWAETDDKHARGALRQTLYFLRRSLGEGVILARGDDEIRLDPKSIWCDTVAFDQALQRGDLREALSLYRGDFLDGLHVSDLLEVEWWIEETRSRLRNQALSAAEQLIIEAKAGGDASEAIETARLSVELAPTSAQAVTALIELLAERGEVAEALRAYRTFEQRLSQGLELQPPDEIRAIAERIRSHPVKSGASGQSPTISPPNAPVEAERVPVTIGGTSDDTPMRPVPASGPPGAGGDRVRPPVRLRGRVVGIVSLVIAATIAYGAFHETLRHVPAEPARVLISVFDGRSPGVSPEDDVLSLADEITRALVGSDRFAPLARRPDGPVDPGAARSELRADYVVSGTVRGNRDELLVSVQLVSTESQLVVWSERYEYAASRSRGWQDDVSRNVLAQMTRTVAPDSERPSPAEPTAPRGAPPTLDRDAYFAYWDGRALWHQRQPALLLEALRSFRRAIAIDPDFAEPFAAIADVYNLLAAYDYGVQRPTLALPAAVDSAREAIERNADLGEAWAALGFASASYERDFDAAREAFGRALAASPAYAPAHHWYSLLLLAEGRSSESFSHIERARELDPASPVIRTAVGRHHYYRRDYAQAIADYQQAILVDSDFPPAHMGLGVSYALLGRLDEAATAYDRAAAIVGTDSPLVTAMRGHLLALSGDTVAAEALAATLEESTSWVPPEYRAIVQLGLGRRDQAIALLEEAYDEHSAVMLFLHVDPLLDALRGEPAFEALVGRVGIAPGS